MLIKGNKYKLDLWLPIVNLAYFMKVNKKIKLCFFNDGNLP